MSFSEFSGFNYNSLPVGVFNLNQGYESGENSDGDGYDPLVDTPVETSPENRKNYMTIIKKDKKDDSDDSEGDPYGVSPLTHDFSGGWQVWNSNLTNLQENSVYEYKPSTIELHLSTDTKEPSTYVFNPLHQVTAGDFTAIFIDDYDYSSEEYSRARLHPWQNRYDDMLVQNTKIYAPVIGKKQILRNCYYLLATKFDFKIENINFSYITTQAPLCSTFMSFFKAMVIGGSKLIVNLAMLIENGKVKCDDYWSDNQWSLTPVIEITDGNSIIATITKVLGRDEILKEEDNERIVRRKFTCTPSDGLGEPYTISQIHYENWPDHGTPNPKLFNDLLNLLDLEESQDIGPITVHCSAGVGRSGTLIAVRALEKQVKMQMDEGLNPEVNPFELVTAMRKERAGMVQSAEQWLFIHKMIHIRAKQRKSEKEMTP